ncbi:hypothetical protein [Blastococcus capsensis]|uniref:hypothetical protein n=1 Tax=Blastococcus capsensis TaxID=1564163 RepID=UPI002540FB27|nr:hypothetical protein [Blastococcus capsensis]MDK3257106.1 hypothetical protein [Blastococcus capsensis]
MAALGPRCADRRRRGPTGQITNVLSGLRTELYGKGEMRDRTHVDDHAPPCTPSSAVAAPARRT